MQQQKGALVNPRLNQLRAIMQEQEIEAVLVSSTANCRYLSGFRGEGALLLTHDAARLLTSFVYTLQAQTEAPAFSLHQFTAEKPMTRVIAEVVAELGITRLAFESPYVTVDLHTTLSERLNAAHREGHLPTLPTLQPVKGLVEKLRTVKDGDELATLRQAIAITDDAIAAVLPQLRPQHTERQAAWMLEVAMRERGAESIAFPIIVAVGPRGAQPHAIPGDTTLTPGAPIVIDMGARYQGYHADLTRTVVLGEPDARFWEIYNTVLAAQQAAFEGLRAGMQAAQADALARDYIANAGYGEAFGHSLGHGVGLHVHEEPTLRRTAEESLPAGSVFSVEPGIYLEEWGGVRIEDLVLLRENGCEVLSQAPKHPVIKLL
jgi:Xaa-Pro aminopeptidase